jgi:hypothetical protein
LIRTAGLLLTDQSWRIDAYLSMQQAAALAGWNEALERLQGSLLGHEDWQSDWWMEPSARPSTRHRS